MELYIKNMVCPRCITSVKNILDKINVSYQDVQLGVTILKENPSSKTIAQFKKLLETKGFELLQCEEEKIICQIKSHIIEKIHLTDEPPTEVLSVALSNLLHTEYSKLSKLFSKTEGITIEQFYTLQRVEKVKELLSYNELTISEIANQMGYSSSAYLSTQFKKITGYTPTQFQQKQELDRKLISDI